MSTATTGDSTAEEMLAELSVQGDRIYNADLQATLEPEQNGQVVAIHPETQSYAVARTASDARRLLRVSQPKGLIWTRMIGPETRHSLIRRILGARLLPHGTSAK